MSQEIRFEHSGPLPPAAILEQYNNVVDGAAERIIAMAEKEQDHRHTLVNQKLQAEIADQYRFRDERARGQHYGLVIGITALACSTIIAFTGAAMAAGWIGAGGVGSLVMAFLVDHNLAKRSKSKSATSPPAQTES